MLFIVNLGAISGMKTGLEWLNVRSEQTVSLRTCVEEEQYEPSNCLEEYKFVEEGDSDDISAKKDLKIFSEYLATISWFSG